MIKSGADYIQSQHAFTPASSESQSTKDEGSEQSLVDKGPGEQANFSALKSTSNKRDGNPDL